ncbi:MAG: lipopolysaccharide heptosyltransferase family protein [Prochlorococcaceae cyanobacterium]
MRALFLIPGGGSTQLQAFPAVAAAAEQLGATVQVACSPEATPLWGLLPAVEKVIPFNFSEANLADWSNLLGSVRDPDFQVCLNLAGGRQVDLMLSMSHIPTRIAASGFSATERVQPGGGWPNQALAAYLKPIGVELKADAFRLALPKAELEAAAAALPAGDGPLLLLAPRGGSGDWPASQWQELPSSIRARLPQLRSLAAPAASGPSQLRRRAALVASADVVLASDPLTIELALLCAVPLVALGRSQDSLPSRADLKALAPEGGLEQLGVPEVMAALGFG